MPDEFLAHLGTYRIPVVLAGLFPESRPLEHMLRLAIALAAYAAIQLVVVFVFANGPFTDEAIYVTAGKRILEGFAFQKEHPDYFYWKWFQGSPFLWPPLAAIGYSFGGIVGSRSLAIALSTCSLALFFFAWRRQLGEREALAASVVLAVNSHFFSLGHFAVYDTLALVFLVASIAALMHARNSQSDVPTALSALLFAIAVMSKYGFAIALPGIWALWLLDGKRGLRRASLYSAIVALLVCGYCLSTFGTPFPSSFSWYLAHDSLLSREAVARKLLNEISPVLAMWAVGLWLCTNGQRLKMALATILPTVLVIGGHVAVGGDVSAQKHLVIAVLFLSPLAGKAFARVYASRGVAVGSLLLLALAANGGHLWFTTEHSWPDPTPVSDFLLSRWNKGDALVAEDAWSHRMPLYMERKIDSPFDVFDAWNIDHGRRDLCQERWHIGKTIDGQGDRVTAIAERCGHKPVFQFESYVFAMKTKDGSGRQAVRQIVYEGQSRP